MDIFENDPFSELAVLDRIVHRPFKPQYLDSALSPEIMRCFTSDFSVLAQDGSIRVLDYTPRGTPLQQNRLNKRRMNKIPIPRIGEGFTVNTEQKRDVSTLSMDGQVEASKTIIDQHTGSVNDNMDVTVERQLAHAVRGFITDLDEDVVVDLYDELGAEQQVHTIDVTDTKTPWFRQLQTAKSMVDDGLTGENTASYLMLPGRGLGRWLESDKYYTQAQTSEAAVRLSMTDNRAGVRLTPDVNVLPSRKGYFEPFECHLVPVIPGFFRKVLGPSDSAQYENQVLERYVTRHDLPHGHGWEFQVTQFVLQYARKPGAIVRLKFEGIDEADYDG